MEFTWLTLLIVLLIGTLAGIWIGIRAGEHKDSWPGDSHDQEQAINTMNEIEFLLPEDIQLKQKKQQFIPWQVVEAGISRIIKEIIKTKYEPEIVVGIGRGGGVVGCMIAGNLGNKPVTIIDRKLLFKNGQLVTVFNETPADVIQAKKILLVIGGPSSGRAVLETAQKISSDINRTVEIKTVNLFEKQPVAYSADFTYKSFKVGLKPPWQIKEEYKGFSSSD